MCCFGSKQPLFLQIKSPPLSTIFSSHHQTSVSSSPTQLTISQIIKSIHQTSRKSKELHFINHNQYNTSKSYLIETQWILQYTLFLQNEQQSIRNINNQTFLNCNRQIKKQLKQYEHYYVISQKVWNLLHLLYGGTTIPNHVTHQNYKSLEVKMCGIIYKHTTYGSATQTMLQALLSNAQLTYYFSKASHYTNINCTKLTPYHHSMHKIIKDITELSEDSCYIQINRHIRPQCSQVQPSKLFHKLYSTWSNQIENYSLKSSQFLSQMFDFGVQLGFTCTNCHEYTYKSQRVHQLQLQVTDKKLQNCIMNHLNGLKQSESTCLRCMSTSSSSQSVTITQFPQQLVISLNKKTQPSNPAQRVKYAHNLTINYHCSYHVQYQLRSVISYKKVADKQGIYSCFTKRFKNWYYCDSIQYQEVTAKQVLGRNAQMLFYKKLN